MLHPAHVLLEFPHILLSTVRGTADFIIVNDQHENSSVIKEAK
jgi:hypothetical protein